MRNDESTDDLELSADLVRRLRQLEEIVRPEEMGEVWIFPPLEEPEGTQEFVLFTRVAGEEERAVYSARQRPGESDAPGQTVVEHGRAPVDRLPGLVEDLLRRLGDEREPVHVSVEGSRRCWNELVTRLPGGSSGEGEAEAA